MTPLHAKIRDLHYYGRPLLRERIVWLPADRSLQADIGGSPIDIVYERPHGPVRGRACGADPLVARTPSRPADGAEYRPTCASVHRRPSRAGWRSS